MSKWIFLIVLFCFGTNNFAAGRSPAVEDFVGVEPEGVDFSKAPINNVFNPVNFSKLNANTPVGQSNNFAIFVLFAMIASLPLMSWFVLSKKSKSEDLSNVRHLKDYRNEEDQEEDDISKAS